MAQQARGLKHRGVLHGGGDAVIERLDLRPDVARGEHLARDAVGARNGGRIRSGIVLRAHREDRPHAIDQTVGDRGRDDLAAQAVALQSRREALLHRRRESSALSSADRYGSSGTLEWMSARYSQILP